MQTSMSSARLYIVFCEGRRWWWLPLKKGFSHCYVVKDCGECWVKCQPYSGFTDVTVWSKAICPKVTDLLAEPSLVLPYETTGDYDKIRGHLCWFNCVEVVKSFLGLKKPFIFTPYQLYRFLNEYGQKCGKT